MECKTSSTSFKISSEDLVLQGIIGDGLFKALSSFAGDETCKIDGGGAIDAPGNGGIDKGAKGTCLGWDVPLRKKNHI